MESDPAWFTCTRPSDCVATGTSCCTELAAVRADARAAYERFVCPESCPPGCLCACFGAFGAAATCEAGRCVLASPTPTEIACSADDECVELPARCGTCDDEAFYCVVSGALSVHRDAARAFEDRLCGPDEALCRDLPDRVFARAMEPRCVGGRCELAPF